MLAKAREVCLAQPEATEQIAWGEPTWRLGGKLFAQFDDHHHGGEHVSIWLPAPEGAQGALIDAEPEHIWRPPYVGHLGWIAVKLDTDPPWPMVEALVAQAHQLIASKQKPKRVTASRPTTRRRRS
ncbi:MAG: MmcQ/YjbR family DNA-binding protein [Deltaproteobacteria bacterium]|nr:MmcQ/YjbR family DNA-binding protein [Deltaproteobacteria bacterium]